jgi:hypothetical protein
MCDSKYDQNRIIDFLMRFSDVQIARFTLTSTQLKKSIIDANEEIRRQFRRTGFHDYQNQLSGESGKVVVPVVALCGKTLQQTTMTLYRARSNGDPRLWIGRLRRIYPEARMGDQFLIAQDGQRALILDVASTELDNDVEMLVSSVFSW